MIDFKLPNKLDSTQTVLLKVHLLSDGSEYPLVRIENPFTDSKAYVYDNGGEVTVSAEDAVLVPG